MSREPSPIASIEYIVYTSGEGLDIFRSGTAPATASMLGATALPCSPLHQTDFRARHHRGSAQHHGL